MAAAERYKLVVEGIEPGADLKRVKEDVSYRFNLHRDKVDLLFSKEKVVIKEGLDRELAWHVRQLLEDMHVKASVIPMSTLDFRTDQLELLPAGAEISSSQGHANSGPAGQGEMGVEPGSSRFQARPLSTNAVNVKSQPYRSRETRIRSGRKPQRTWKLSTFVVLVLAIVGAATLGKWATRPVVEPPDFVSATNASE